MFWIELIIVLAIIFIGVRVGVRSLRWQEESECLL